MGVVSRYTSLRRAGRRLVGLCPFHQENTASFTVDPERQLWHCFGCGAGGNVFHFLMKAENLPFPEAAARLAREAGLELEGSQQSARRMSEVEVLARVNLEAASFYRQQLEGKGGERARAYLAERGISGELAAEFGLGYAPAGWDGLFTHLRGAGYPAAAITKTGLCQPRPRGEGSYDRFRDRLMFPIFDSEDRVVAFGGRLLPGGQGTGEERPEAKYINSPETPLFAKGKMLYGLNLARKAMGQAGRALIVEGYLDLIACHQFGFRETVATLGTALTEHHLRLLRRYTERVYTAFDSDSAGLAATLRSRELFVQAGLEARVLVMPPGDDPDTLLRERGREALEQALAQAPDPVQYELGIMAARHLGTPGGEVKLSREAVALLAGVSSAVARAEYARHLAELMTAAAPGRTAIIEAALHQELRKAAPPHPGRPGRGSAPAAPAPAAQAAAGPLLERYVIAAMLQDHACRRRALEALGESHFGHAPYRDLFRAVCQAGPGEGFSPAELANAPEHAPLVSELATGPCPLTDTERAFEGALERLEEGRLRRRVRELDQQIRDQSRLEAGSELLAEYMEARRRLSRITGRRSVGETRPGPA